MNRQIIITQIYTSLSSYYELDMLVYICICTVDVSDGNVQKVSGTATCGYYF